MLRRLAPPDLTSLAWAGRGCAAAVASTAMMQCAKHAKMRAFFTCFNPLTLQDVRSHAACGGNMEVLEWLHDTGCPLGGVQTMCSQTMGAHAAAAGQLEVVKWLHFRGCPWRSAPSSRPAIVLLYQAGDYSFSTCYAAASSGHLDVLRWERAHGATWDEHTCELAAMGGHLEVLQWLRAHNCPWAGLTLVHLSAQPEPFSH